MGTASMRKWVRRYGSREAAVHGRLRERRRRAFDRALQRAVELGERTGVDPAAHLRGATFAPLQTG
ncbi:MAG TPA: hypothetical protein VIG99_03585 [Myxococcaceae bacterium]|jgi:hypothetical protein